MSETALPETTPRFAAIKVDWSICIRLLLSFAPLGRQMNSSRPPIVYDHRRGLEALATRV
jgi:hypothetical protein